MNSVNACEIQPGWQIWHEGAWHQVTARHIDPGETRHMYRSSTVTLQLQGRRHPLIFDATSRMAARLGGDP